MKKTTYIIVIAMFLGACKDDESVSCTICSSPQTPDFELCRESNGNASVNGEDTGTQYEVYLDGLLELGANCGSI